MPRKSYPEDFHIRSLLQKVKVKEIMVTRIIKLYEDDELSKAEELIITHGISYLPVVDHNERLVGLLSQKYLYKTQSPRKIDREEIDYDPGIIIDGHSFYDKETLDSYILRNIMLKDPFTLGPEDPLSKAILEMAKQNLGCICIVKENKKICGIVTYKEVGSLAASILTE